MKTPFLFCFLLSSLTLFSQTIVWEKAFNKSRFDGFRCVRSTTDGGCIWGGEYHTSYLSDTIVSEKKVSNRNGQDMRVVKLNTLGEIEWDKTYGDSCGNELKDIKQTSDGGYLILGSRYYRSKKSGKLNLFNDAWVIKINSAGNVEWEKLYPQFRGFEGITIIEVTNDSGFLLASDKYKHVFKFDSKGVLQWKNTIKIRNFNRIECLCQESDGAFILGGLTYESVRNSKSTGEIERNNFLIKINTKGRIQKKKIYADLDSIGIRDIKKSIDGGYLIGGVGLQSGKNVDFCLLKINSKMQQQWRKYYGGTKVDDLRSIISNSDGTIVLAGTTYSLDGDVKSGYRGKGDYWLLKINAQGDILWEKTYGSSIDESLSNAQLSSDECYYIGGTIGHFVGPLEGDIDSWYPKEKTTENMESDVISKTKSGRLNTWIVKVKNDK